MDIVVEGIIYNVTIWDPLFPVFNCKWLACDTETEEIINGAPIVPVIAQVFNLSTRSVHIVRAEHIPIYLEKTFKENPKTRWVFHTASFDLDVLDWKNNKFKALVEEDLVTDMYIRIILYDLAKGTHRIGFYGLDKLAKSRLGITLSKDKDIRLTFKKGMELTDNYVTYAAKDAIVTGLLYAKYSEMQPTEQLQFKSSIVLRAISNNGLLVDDIEFKKLVVKYETLAKDSANTLSLFGWYKGLKGNSFIWQNLLKNIEERCNIKLPKTEKTKKLKITEDVLENLEATNNLHPVLRSYKDNTHYNKMLSTYLSTANIGVDNRLHSYFSVLVSSGRTSSSKPNIQNFPRVGGLRGYIIAPQGHVLVSCDYSQVELCVLAQSCLSRFGKSVMADLINEDKDLHTHMGAYIAESEGRDITILTKKEKKKYRSLAKVPNFGFPGGLGPNSLISFAKNTYNVSISLEEAKKLKELWLEIYPEMTDHLKGDLDDFWTNKLFREYSNILYPGKYIDSWDELEFKLKEDGLNDSEVFNIKSNIYRYKYTTLSGRTKSNCTFNAAANGRFQSDAADGAKKALWNIYKAGFKIVNFIHDEIIVELPIDDNLSECVKVLSDIMVKSMQELIPDVRIKTEPVASVRWYKEAEPVYDSQGNITIWHPDIFTPKEFVKDIEDANLKSLENKCIQKNLNILYSTANKETIYGFEKKGENPINWY